MRWPDTPTYVTNDDQRWDFRSGTGILVDNDLCPDRLASALPEIGLVVDGAGQWSLPFDALCSVFLDLFFLPARKDTSWGTQNWWVGDYMPTPAMFRRGWAVLLEHASASLWEETTPAIFTERLTSMFLKLPAEHQAYFEIASSDLEEWLGFSLNNSDWPRSHWDSAQWFLHMSWERGSAGRIEDGRVQLVSLLTHVFGGTMTTLSMDTGSSFHMALRSIHAWCNNTPGVVPPTGAFDVDATLMELRQSAALMADLLRPCTLMPTVARQYRQAGVMRGAWFASVLRFNACSLNGSSTAWLLEGMTLTLARPCPIVRHFAVGCQPRCRSGIRRLATPLSSS